MQVNVVSINSVPEVQLKQDSKNITNDNSFKNAVDSAIQSNKDTSLKNNDSIKTNDNVEPKTEITEDNKDETKTSKDANVNLSILISQLLSGKIDLSELTASIKEDIQSIMKSNPALPQIDDKKLSEVVNKLFQNLLSGTEKLKGENVSKLIDKNIHNSFAVFNQDIVKLIQEANSSDKINGSDITKLLDKVDMSVLLSSKPEASGTNVSAYVNLYDDILYALKVKVSEQANNKINNAPMQTENSVGNAKNTDKLVQNYLVQDIKNNTDNSNKQDQLPLSKENKNQNSDASGDGFLKSLISNDKDNKFSKVSNFMTQFNNIQNNVPVAQNDSIIVNKATFSNDIFKAVKYMDINGIKDLTVKIMPKELGEVVIKLTLENGVMKANITAANKDAYNLLNSNIKDISDKLQDSNIKIQNFNINMYSEDTTFFKDGSDRQNSGGFRGRKNNSVIEDITNEESDTDNASVVYDNALNALV